MKKGGKPCNTCEVVKPLSEFGWTNATETRRRNHCKDCWAVKCLARRVPKPKTESVSKADHKMMIRLNMQRQREVRKAANVCVICGAAPPREGLLMCEACSAQESFRQMRYTREVTDKLFEIYGGYVCACCGEDNRGFMTLDHINNDGAEHRRKIADGKNGGIGYRTLYTALRKMGFPPILQVLCYNCNLGKARNGGVCPHQEAVKKAA